MADWIKPGHKIGVIGSGNDTSEVILAAKRMGYIVSTYNPNDSKGSGKVSDFYIKGEYNDAESLIKFAETVDVLLYTTRQIDSALIETLSEVTEVPQKEFILSLSQDKILRKSIFEENDIIVPPQEVVVNKEDMYSAIESIGYPCVLKSNTSWSKKSKHILFYEEAEVDKFNFETANIGVGVLEAWVPVEAELTVVVSVDNHKNIFPVTLSQTSYRDGKLYRSYNPPHVNDEIAIQSFYIAERIAEINDFYGVLSVEFLKTSAGVLYVKDVIPFISPSAAYTKYTQNLSQYELFVRSVTHWPIPGVVHHSSATMIQFYNEHEDKVFSEVSNHPEWLIDLYRNNQDDQPSGQIIVVSDDNEETLKNFADLDIWHRSSN